MDMGEILRIRGGIPLRGHVTISGGKNASAPIIPAALLAKAPCTLENIPDNEDSHVLMETIRALGGKAELNGNTMVIDSTGLNSCTPPDELVRRMRASYYFVPVLVGLMGHAELSVPGGCNIGKRPIDQTLRGLQALGVDARTEMGKIVATAGTLRGADVYLDMPSVGATVNTMLMAVSVEGHTTIHNAAKEPHVVDLANFLGAMGAQVKGAGTDIIRVTGGRPLHGTSYTIIPDQIETGTMMIAAAATGGDVTIHGAIPYHMEALTAKLLESGAKVDIEDDCIRVRREGRMRAVDVKTHTYPGFPTDLQQPMTAMLAIAEGKSTIDERIFESRLSYTEQLTRMGANIDVVDNRIAYVYGVKCLVGNRITAPDLRAGAAMVVAGLIAEGVTEIEGAHYIRRGYEHLEEKLRVLGADIESVEG